MLKLKKLMAICFATLVFILSSCATGTDETLNEMQSSIESNTTVDPEDDEDGGGIGTANDPGDDEDGGGIGTANDPEDDEDGGGIG